MTRLRSWINVLGLAGLAGGLSVGLLWVLLHRVRDVEDLQRLARRDFPDVPRIQVAELREWLTDPSRQAPQLVDVRTPEEFAVSRLPGALQVDPNSRAGSVRDLLEPGRPAVFYCSVGYRSAALVQALMVSGVTNVWNLEGSIFAWANADLPLEIPATGLPTRMVHPFSASYASLLPADRRYQVPAIESVRNETTYWQRLRVAAGVAWLAILLGWETWMPTFAWHRGRIRERCEHGLRNIVLGLMNTVVVAVLFAQSWLWAAHLAQDHHFGLLNWLPAPTGVRLVAAILLLDAWMYLWHRLNHGIGFLWRFHRVHHSELTMDVTSATRFHVGEIALSSLIRIPLILLLGLRFGELLAYETLLFAVVQFHHANIRLPALIERILSWCVVTPAIHRVHHSQWQPETDSNFASLLSAWDRLFGTSRTREAMGESELGLAEYREPADHTLAGMLETPLAVRRRFTARR